MSDVQTTRNTSRFLRRPAIVAGLALAAGIALWPATTPDPATPAQQAAARALMRCKPDTDDCFATLRYATAAVCAPLLQNGGETSFVGAGLCPGDSGFSTPVAAQRPLRFLQCAKRDGALDAWHAFPSPSTPATVCGVELRLSRSQMRAWVNRLDAASSTAFVDVRRTNRPADLKRGAELVSTWEGVDPADETDDSNTIDFSDPLDGGVP